MRIVTFDDFVPGLLRGNEVVDATPALGDIARLPWDERIPALIASYDHLRSSLTRLAADGKGTPLASVRLRAPNPRPERILCGLVNYDAEPGKLDFTFKSPESIIGPEDTIELPNLAAGRFQHEPALAYVVGREAKNVAEGAGPSYIFGYTALLDVFGTDLGRGVGTFLGKSSDTFGPMGPCIVTCDELPDPHALTVRLTVNGAPRCSYSTAAMANRIGAQVAIASGFMTLQPGDLVTCGNPQEAVGTLTDGDDVHIEIESIGGFRVRVKDALHRTWPAEESKR